MSLWQSLRPQLAFFLLGLLLGILIAAAAADRQSNDIDIKMMQVDIAHLQEKISDIAKRQDAVLAWINASDKQKVMDAEEYGGVKATVAAHERIVWVIVGQGVALIFLLVEFAIRMRKKT
jgi:hypothetical protein